MSDGATLRGRHHAWVRPSLRTWVTVAVVSLTVALNLLQQPGLVTFDTKLDLQFDPGGFLSRSLSLWNGDSAIGGLQNQASGYLFPMGPVFLLGEVLGVPMWVWERLWSAAVMLLAYGGARRLASHWPGVSTTGSVLAGLTYMLAPRVLTTVGALSGETLPAAVLPWTVLPLVLYLRGTLRARVALLASAATIPWMGGQNATLVLACLVLPALLLAFTHGRTWRRRLTDLFSWGVLVVLASLWWLLPLLLLGGYAPPFLDFIESSHNTANDIGLMSSLRGTSHWVALFPGGGSAGWSGGYALASSHVLLVTSVLVAGAGLLGLARADLWARKVLVGAVLVGLAVLTLGTGGWAGSMLSNVWLDALDTWLAPLRNVHKFDPLVRLPLSIGVGAFVSTGLQEMVERSRRLGGPRARRAVLVLTALVAVAVVAPLQPAARGELRSAGGMRDISAAWRGAVDYLDSQPGPVSVLVLPGSGFATQFWGRTVDEPIQVLGGPPWLSRAQVTVAPAGSLRLMDSIERQIRQGRSTPAMSATLRRLGITHVVVRNDLDPGETDAPPPDVVYASLGGADDLRSAARFGPQEGGHPSVEVFALAQVGGDPRATLLDWQDRKVVQGGQEVVNDLVADGLVGADQATELTSEGARRAADILTDSNRRAERSFGRVHEAVSATMTKDDEFRVERSVHDYVGDQVPDSMTTVDYEGAEQVTASSSGGYADVLGPVRPEEHPYAAFDDSYFTAWTTAPFSSPEGQWVAARFDSPVDPGPVNLLFDTNGGAKVQAVRLTTDGGDRTVRIGQDGRADDIDLPGTATRTLRLTVVKAAHGDNQVRLSDFSLGRHDIERTLRLPGRLTAQGSVHLSSDLPRRACVRTERGASCDQAWQRESLETSGFDRTVEVGEAASWHVAGRAVATDGAAAARLLGPLSDTMVSLTATSTFGGDPLVAAANAFDGSVATGWYSAPLDPAPGLRLAWRQKRVISEVGAVLEGNQPGVLPAALVVDPMTRGSKPQLVTTSGRRTGVMRPVRTNRLRVTVPPDADRVEGVGISELRIRGLEDLGYTPDAQAPTGVLCGFGPTVDVAGTKVELGVKGTLADVLTGADLELQPCDDGAATMKAGTQRVRVTNRSGFAVSRLWLEPSGSSTEEATSSSSRVTSWSPTERTVAVRATDESVLALPQSANRGWQASLGGSRLAPVVVDGWKQGWLVPAGTSGDVQMEFEPQGAFRWGILAGLLAALLVTAGAAVGLVLAKRSPSAPRATARASLPRRWWVHAAELVGLVCLGLVSLPLAGGAILGWLTRRVDAVTVSASCLGALALAALLTAFGSSAIAPPVVAEVVVALVVGIVAARVLSARRRAGGHERPVVGVPASVRVLWHPRRDRGQVHPRHRGQPVVTAITPGRATRQDGP